MASRAVIFGLIVYLSAWPSTIGSCPDGTYGYQCGYRCNCDQDRCDSSSGCSPPACHPGWSGPTCQKHNVARKKVTSSSGEGLWPSSTATDGSTAAHTYSVCIDTAPSNPNWWRVDLNDTVLIREVTIYFRLDYKARRNGIQVYVTNSTDAPSGHNCFTVTGGSDGRDIADVTRAPCSGMGRYILLYTTVNKTGDSLPVLDFCEVEVDVCAPGTFGADCNNYCHCDGEVCQYVSGICPSGMCMSGWRGNSCNTTCPMGNFGRRCSKRCTDRMCKDNTSSCNYATGECSGGCLAGYHKPDCTQSCVQDVEYGAGCTGNCSARMCEGGSGTCPRDTGLCSDGCQSGWTGEDCTQSVVSSLSPVTSMSPAVAGNVGSLTMLMVLVVVVGMVCLWRKGDFRMNKDMPRQDSSTPETSPAPPVELPTYDVLPDQDYTKLDRIHTEHYETLQPTVDYQNTM